MSQYFPPYEDSSKSIKVDLDLSNYATKDDVKNITRVDVSSYTSKSNLAALKTEVDKIDTDKLKTVPDDLAKLSNVVKNDVLKKTEYNALKTKVDGIDTSAFATRTKFTVDTNSLDDKIDKVEKKVPVLTDFVTTTHFNHEKNLLATKAALTTVENKIPDISNLATKTSLCSLLTVSTFNSKVTELEGKVTTVDNKFSGYAKKTDVASDITKIKNDYATNASSDSKLNDLEAQHISTEVKKIDDKTKKNASDILGFESRLKQKEDIVDDNQRGLSFNRGFFFYIDQSYLVYDCKMCCFNFSSEKISVWKSTGIFNYLDNSNINAVGDSKNNLPALKYDGRMYVYLGSNYFEQNKVITPNNNNVINTYCVYELQPMTPSRDDTFTIQNVLFGAMQITKNSDTSKYNYKGYGICFDEGGTFSKGNINNGQNVLIFDVDESSLVHANNKANNIYVMGDLFVRGINDRTLYAGKVYSQNFTQQSKKFVVSLHNNGDDNYLFVNGKQELKFKCKTEHLVKEKLCLGNLSDQWTMSESEKTGLHGNIYDFVVDFEQIVGIGPIYDFHRYLMIKHNIK